MAFHSETESSAAAWPRWFIPSVGDLIFVAFLTLLSCTALSVRLLGDAGIGWHIRTGQAILATHAIPRIDLFSSSMPGQPWFAWEWLYDTVVGWLDQSAGINAVVFLTALTIAITFSLTFHFLLRRGTNLLVAVVLGLLAASASMIHFFARPHIFSWLFSVVWFWILDSSEIDSSEHRRLLWLLPLLMIIWVNLHGGFLLGFVLLGIYFLSAVWRSFRPHGDRFSDAVEKIRAGKRARTLALTGILSLLATFINPYGWKLHLHIYRYLSNRFLMDHIDEFQSPNFHGVAQKCFAVLLLLALVALACKQWYHVEFRLSQPLLLLFAVYSGLYASRNIPVSSLLLILVIGPLLSAALTGKSEPAPPSFLRRMQSIDSSLRGHLWPIAATLLLGWIAFHGGRLGDVQRMNAHFDARRFPVAAVDYLQQHHPPTSIFAPDSWGGYLIYRLYPQTKVALDDRHDFYGEQFLKAYLRTIHVEPGWQDFLRDHQVQCIVVPKDSALASILLETPRWRSIYSDNVAAVFFENPPTIAP